MDKQAVAAIAARIPTADLAGARVLAVEAIDHILRALAEERANGRMDHDVDDAIEALTDAVEARRIAKAA